LLQETIEAGVGKELQSMEKALAEMAEVLRVLNHEQERLTEVVLQRGAMSNGGGDAQDVKHLMARVKLLEARLPAPNGGRLWEESFRSRNDVLAFVEDHVPSNCFFLFHDVVTLMEALTTSHVECKDVIKLLISR
jgi:hypothetical protein